jgi:hypothetical protein
MGGTRENRDGAPGDVGLGRSVVAIMICERINGLDD